MKKKEKGNNILAIVAGVGVLIFLLVYTQVYNRFVTKAEEIERSNAALSVRVDELKEYYDHREDYISETNQLQVLIGEVLSQYPAGAQEEDVIMQAVKLQTVAPLTISNINIQNGNVIKIVDYDTVTAAQIEEYTSVINYMGMSATYVNEVDYQGLKDIVQTILNSNNRIGISSIAYSKGTAENPKLSGYLDLVFYSVTGTGKEYVAPDITPYLNGTDNIFGEIHVPVTVSEPTEETETEDQTEVVE